MGTRLSPQGGPGQGGEDGGLLGKAPETPAQASVPSRAHLPPCRVPACPPDRHTGCRGQTTCPPPHQTEAGTAPHPPCACHCLRPGPGARPHTGHHGPTSPCGDPLPELTAGHSEARRGGAGRRAVRAQASEPGPDPTRERRPDLQGTARAPAPMLAGQSKTSQEGPVDRK